MEILIYLRKRTLPASFHRDEVFVVRPRVDARSCAGLAPVLVRVGFQAFEAIEAVCARLLAICWLANFGIVAEFGEVRPFAAAGSKFAEVCDLRFLLRR